MEKRIRKHSLLTRDRQVIIKSMTENIITKDKFTIAEHRIKTKDGLHELYVQEWGNPAGQAIFHLHGGPGSGCDDSNKAIYNPKNHRVIFLDQRGSGKSKPAGSLKENTTDKLIDDIQQIILKLGLKKVNIYGRSWGSTLALCYAINYPDKVKTLIIGGVFLGTQPEIDWIEKAQFRTFYPEVEKEEKITPYTYAKLAIPTLKLDDRFQLPEREDFDENKFKIELHYTANNCFLPDNFILDNAGKIKSPVHIIQGRYDMMTPPINAYSLAQKLERGKIYWTIAGHAGSDRANYDVTKSVLENI